MTAWIIADDPIRECNCLTHSVNLMNAMKLILNEFLMSDHGETNIGELLTLLIAHWDDHSILDTLDSGNHVKCSRKPFRCLLFWWWEIRNRSI